MVKTLKKEQVSMRHKEKENKSYQAANKPTSKNSEDVCLYTLCGKNIFLY